MFIDIKSFNLQPENIIIYLRKSRADDPSLSIDEVLEKHEAILDEWSVKNLGYYIPNQNKYKEIISGETIAEREQIQKILKLIESPKYKAILTVEVQRLSRGDLEDAGKILKILRFTHTLVITPLYIYDLENEYDRDNFERELKRGNEYLEYQKKIMRRGREYSVSQGNYIGSVAPYGYNKAFILENKKKCPTLEINEDEANVVKMIFDMYANQNLGVTTIRKYLNSQNIPTKNNTAWIDGTIKDMLRNETYSGKTVWNKRKTIIEIENGKLNKTRPEQKEYRIYEGKHEAIISEELFNKASAKHFDKYKPKSFIKVRNPLAGLIYCECGRPMIYRQYLNKGKKKCEPRLLCENQIYCRNGSCTYKTMINIVKNLLGKEIENEKIGNITAEKENKTKQLDFLQKKLKQLEVKELLQWEAQTDPNEKSRMPKEIFEALNSKLQTEKQAIKNNISITRQSIALEENKKDRTKYLIDAFNAIDNENIPAEVKSKILKTVIERITYRRDKPERLTRQKEIEINPNFVPNKTYWSKPNIEIDIKFKI